MDCLTLISLTVNLIGLILLFVGNLKVTDAVTRYNARDFPGFKTGNRLQIVGFVLSICGVMLSTLG